MNNMLVSVIVPIFNTEKELEKCILSIMKQTYKNIEIILVDDGSTDGSLGICKKYRETDKRINLIHKKNEGVSTARNIGIDNAKGDAVVFVDSDDYIKEDMIERLMIKSDYDLVVAGYFYCEESRETAVLPKETSIYSKNEIINVATLKSYMSFFTIPICKLFKREIIDKYKIRFDNTISYGEDTCFIYNYIKYIESCYCLSEPIYYNVIRQGSLSRSIITDPWVPMYKVFKYFLNIYSEQSTKECYPETVTRVLLRSIKLSIVNAVYANLKIKEFKRLMNDIRNIPEWKRVNKSYIKKLSYDGIILWCVTRKLDSMLYLLFSLKLRLH